jgi:hypothetical protein
MAKAPDRETLEQFRARVIGELRRTHQTPETVIAAIPHHEWRDWYVGHKTVEDAVRSAAAWCHNWHVRKGRR